ncbi:DNA repair protein XRCC4-like [Corythoichthys intestinalis]|uniref:DNA repair protein XRCC4-like n=1 Tax=Corythoichthys intestinalis TaxID=161448 RepID=UPI0025A50174|nr:DNA repair protein XRCC4-like [Corythoichthys intestinalis]
MHSSVREILISSEPDSPYFLRVDGSGWDTASGFRLLLSDGRHAWRGEASEASVCQEAAELEMPEDKYIQDLREALTGEGSPASYRLTLLPSPPDGGAELTLTYHKVQKDISFRLGSVMLNPVPEPREAVRALLTYSLERGTSLERHNQELREQNRRLGREHGRIAAELKRYAIGREELETELYSRFVVVLNEKKAKIRSLQEKLKALQEVRSDKTDLENDEYAGSTDEDAEAAPDAAAAAASDEARPCSPTPLDDITDVAPNRKRRFRHRGAPADTAVKRPHARNTPLAATDPLPLRRPDEEEDLFEDF